MGKSTFLKPLLIDGNLDGSLVKDDTEINTEDDLYQPSS